MSGCKQMHGDLDGLSHWIQELLGKAFMTIALPRLYRIMTWGLKGSTSLNIN
eukprot:CAMPEP_0175107198 /NCGR_PEP_ID=MMETSP0086_2-20121207/11732_1 /TAXON_ID=136419 /ORGANISM="Unknown Unknown, Strain D1" /LENGTH=51 /DNA_ID=CAMNT_0016383839 /DNA_START=227 /DNA_END=382 /DNA_ORIENTATION=-